MLPVKNRRVRFRGHGENNRKGLPVFRCRFLESVVPVAGSLPMVAIRNPYAKPKASLKRPRSSWDRERSDCKCQNPSENQNDSNGDRCRVPPQPTTASGTSLLNRRLTTNMSAEKPKQTAQSTISSFDDGGIDWEAAVAMMEQATPESHMNTKSHSTLHSGHESAVTEIPIPAASIPRHSPSKSLMSTKRGPPDAVYEHPSTRLTSDPTRLKPPPRPTNTASVPSLSSRSSVALPTLASLRPASWAGNCSSDPSLFAVSVSSSPAKSKSNLTTSSPSTHPRSRTAVSPSMRPSSWQRTAPPASPDSDVPSDPRQVNLPKKLQFDVATVQPVQDEHRQTLVQNATLSQPLLNGWTLFSHQKKAILQGLLMRRMILALDMGLGKTLIGCVWAKAFSKTLQTKTIVICPVSLRDEWKRTAIEATGLSVQDDKDVQDNVNNASLCIASWGKIPRLDKHDLDQRPFVVVADEAHSMQSMAASRTKDVLVLCAHPACRGVLLLTGTPMKNGKPSNLFPLLQAVSHPLGRHQLSYEQHFCAGHSESYGRSRPVWKASGASNLSQLRTLVSSHLLHLTKQDCLKALPPQTREFPVVPISSRQQLAHTQALHDLAKIYRKTGESKSSEAILGAVQRVRLVASTAKIDATVEYAKRILETEPAIVIFTSFVKVAQNVHQKLTDAGWQGSCLTGETVAKSRQALVDNFQNGLTAFFVCTFGAGGVGLTLTAACTVILLDRPWTPGDAHQAEDRVRRIGQTKPVKSLWMTAFDLDKQIDSIIEQKSKTAATVLSTTMTGSSSDATSEGPKLSIFQLIKAILPPNESN
jgi:superfamily II DNA or RNA helicase